MRGGWHFDFQSASAPVSPSVCLTTSCKSDQPQSQRFGQLKRPKQNGARVAAHGQPRKARLLIAAGQHEGEGGAIAVARAAASSSALDGTVTSKVSSAAGATSLPQPPQPAPTSASERPPQRERRAIPREIRRKLIERDGACCTFIGDNGERCSSSAFLQIHHVHAWAKGGADSLDNLRLLCSAHNRLLGELDFGERRRAS